ncbi:MAG: hypothetical protein ACKVON_16135 [Beijerinckiaceae bacterium]
MPETDCHVSFDAGFRLWRAQLATMEPLERNIMIVHDIRPEVRQAIEDSIQEVMQDHALQSIQIVPKEDASGDEAIFVHLKHGFSEQPFASSLSSDLQHRVLDRLIALGEYRFAYIGHAFDDRQKIVK